MAAYDEIADWYELEFLAAQRGRDPLGIGRALRNLLGEGSRVCLEIGCGTGVHAALGREPGWICPPACCATPVAGCRSRSPWTDQGIRDKVGASHWPLPALLNAFLDAGLTPRRFTEGGAPLPLVLGVATTTPPDPHRTHRP